VEQAGAAFAALVRFLREAPFTTRISGLEAALVNSNRDSVQDATSAAALTEDLLHAALIVRRDVGRVSDVIHATVIALALPLILEEGETVITAPSLGPGNDSSRPYDLQTDRRVAEFKVALWTSGNMMRKRGVTADLVHLALDESGRRPELWAAGTEPLRFLQTSTSAVGSLLSRSPQSLRTRHAARFDPDQPLHAFVREHAAHVRLHNIADVLPGVAAALL
jgi:hypothetical protein